MQAPLSLVSSPHLGPGGQGARGPRWSAGYPFRRMGLSGSDSFTWGQQSLHSELYKLLKAQNAVLAELNHVSRASLILQLEQDGAWGSPPPESALWS